MKFEFCVALPKRVHLVWVYFSLINYDPSRVEQDIYMYSQVKNNIYASLISCFFPENRKIFVCNKRKIQLFQVFQLFHSVFRVLDDSGKKGGGGALGNFLLSDTSF